MSDRPPDYYADYIGRRRSDDEPSRMSRSELFKHLQYLENALSLENYRLVYSQYMNLYNGQKLVLDITAALITLHDGFVRLLEKRQVLAATNLARHYVRTLLTEQYTPNNMVFDHVNNMFIKFGLSLAIGREVILMTVIVWTSKFCPDFQHGHPDLHKRIGHTYWSETNYSLAQYHFVRSTDGLGFAKMLVELHRRQGLKEEVDIIIVQAVLYGLCIQNKLIAKSVFKYYVKLHPSIKNEQPYMLPLLNFVHFLLDSIDNGNLKAYSVLREQYRPSLIRDDKYIGYLDKIGELYFDVKTAETSAEQNSFSCGTTDEFDPITDLEPAWIYSQLPVIWSTHTLNAKDQND